MKKRPLDEARGMDMRGTLTRGGVTGVVTVMVATALLAGYTAKAADNRNEGWAYLDAGNEGAGAAQNEGIAAESPSDPCAYGVNHYGSPCDCKERSPNKEVVFRGVDIECNNPFIADEDFLGEFASIFDKSPIFEDIPLMAMAAAGGHEHTCRCNTCDKGHYTCTNHSSCGGCGACENSSNLPHPKCQRKQPCGGFSCKHVQCSSCKLDLCAMYVGSCGRVGHLVCVCASSASQHGPWRCSHPGYRCEGGSHGTTAKKCGHYTCAEELCYTCPYPDCNACWTSNGTATTHLAAHEFARRD